MTTQASHIKERAEYLDAYMDLLSDVLEAKEIMRSRGIGQCDFLTMFKEFAAPPKRQRPHTDHPHRNK